MDKPGVPEVDVKAVAEDLKRFISDNKMDWIDSKNTRIEAYPNENDERYPVMGDFSKKWGELFDYADTVTQDDGAGFPHDLVEAYEDILSKVVKEVNSDTEFWDEIRNEVLPLYEPMPGAEMTPSHVAWKKRWKSVSKFFYDPIPIDVSSSKIMRRQSDGAEVSRELIRSRTIPAGFVVNIG